MTEPCDVTLDVAETEQLARFLLEKHFSILYRSVKPKAFEPPPDLQASVYRVIDLNEDEIWSLGERHVAGPQGKTLKGRADILVRAVLSLRLAVVADNEPCRHAYIDGWPNSKPAQMSLAQQLAAAATFEPR